MVPQYWPLAVAQLTGVQAPESGEKPQMFERPAPPHVCPAGHPPQSSCPPHPLPMMPQ